MQIFNYAKYGIYLAWSLVLTLYSSVQIANNVKYNKLLKLQESPSVLGVIVLQKMAAIGKKTYTIHYMNLLLNLTLVLQSVFLFDLFVYSKILICIFNYVTYYITSSLLFVLLNYNKTIHLSNTAVHISLLILRLTVVDYVDIIYLFYLSICIICGYFIELYKNKLSTTVSKIQKIFFRVFLIFVVCSTIFYILLITSIILNNTVDLYFILHTKKLIVATCILTITYNVELADNKYVELYFTVINANNKEANADNVEVARDRADKETNVEVTRDNYDTNVETKVDTNVEANVVLIIDENDPYQIEGSTTDEGSILSNHSNNSINYITKDELNRLMYLASIRGETIADTPIHYTIPHTPYPATALPYTIPHTPYPATALPYPATALPYPATALPSRLKQPTNYNFSPLPTITEKPPKQPTNNSTNRLERYRLQQPPFRF